MRVVLSFLFARLMALAFVALGRWTYRHPKEAIKKLYGDLDFGFGNFATSMLRVFGVMDLLRGGVLRHWRALSHNASSLKSEFTR